MTKTVTALCIAICLWFSMFSPWTSPYVPFWGTMACSGIILSTLAFLWGDKFPKFSPSWPKQIVLGLALAFVLWWVFWIGDKLSQLMFDFARNQVDGIYGMADGMPKWLVGVLLLFVIGPAEEIFWRGFLQRRFSERYNPWVGFLLTLGFYTFVHLWSFNFMLICAAGVCGFCWGILYRFWPNALPALVISHAIWDVCAFVIFPF